MTDTDTVFAYQFGEAVSVSQDTMLVGAPSESVGGVATGAVYVFVRIGSVWSQQAKLTETNGLANDRFGWRVAVSGDLAVVSAPTAASAGSAYVFRRTGTTWVQQAKLVPSDSQTGNLFGSGLSTDGLTIVVGANGFHTTSGGFGAAYVFTQAGGVWTQTARLSPTGTDNPKHFGDSVVVLGNQIVVGDGHDSTVATFAGAVYVFQLTGGS